MWRRTEVLLASLILLAGCIAMALMLSGAERGAALPFLTALQAADR